jgi:hypothetical protein
LALAGVSLLLLTYRATEAARLEAEAAREVAALAAEERELRAELVRLTQETESQLARARFLARMIPPGLEPENAKPFAEELAALQGENQGPLFRILRDKAGR